MSSHKSFRKIAVTNGYKTTNLVANAALTASYNLVLPSTTPTIAGQSLISDTAGNLSWGSSVGVISNYTGTINPLTTATNVTGLNFTSSFNQTTVYVAVNATTNVYSMYNLKVYQKGSSSSWGLAYEVDCDTDDVDPQLVFTVTSTGQIQYTMPTTYPGFTSIVMVWSLGTGVSNTLSSLVLSSTLNVAGTSTFTAGIQGTSLTLASTFNVAGLATHAAMSGLSLALGNAASSGNVSSTVGTFLSLQNQTYTDTVTAASSTAAGSFSGTYLGIPTLTATNTGVITSTASTLTIAGPPIAGTNETISNAYALNIQSGSTNLNGNVVVGGVLKSPASSLYYKVINSNSISIGNGSTGSNWSLSGYDSNYTNANGSNGVTFVSGVYLIIMTVNFAMPVTGSGNNYCLPGLSVSGSNASCNPTNYQTSGGFNGWNSNNGTYAQLTTVLYVPASANITPTLYNSMGGTINSSVSLTLSQMRAI